MQEDFLTVLQSAFGLRVRANEPMADHTTFRIGGPAQYFVTVSHIRDVRLALHLAREADVPVFVMGNGSNLLVRDHGITGLVLQIAPPVNDIRIKGNTLIAQAGVLLSTLAMRAAKEGLDGLSFAGGIPGTLGGAVAMNAGAYGGEMAQVVTRIDCTTMQGEDVVLEKDDLAFGYRTSAVSARALIALEVHMQLTPADPAGILAAIQDFNARRKAKQPLHLPSAGSTFKRPPGHFAGALIEEAGLKGAMRGGAQVSPLHAGFIVNAGGATCSDVLELIAHIQETVQARFGILLEPEVHVVG